MRSLLRYGLAAGALAFTFAAARPASAVEFLNQAPVAVDDYFTTVVDMPLEIGAPGFLANDHDPDGTVVTTYAESPIRAGGVMYKRTNGSFRFEPTPGFSGTETFTYYAIDADGAQTPAKITIEVLSPNAPPVAVDDQYEAIAGRTLTVPASGVLGNDHDPEGGPLTALLENCGGAGGPHNVRLNPDGSLTFTPAADAADIVFCRYVAIDETGLASPAGITFKVSKPSEPVVPPAPKAPARPGIPKVTG